MEVEAETLVGKPVGDVFAYWSSLERAPEWSDAVIERRKLTEGPVGVGTRYHAVDKWPGRRVEFTVEVTAYEPNERMAATWSEPMRGAWEAKFEETGGGTRMTLRAQANPTGLLGLLSPLMAGWARRQVRRDLDRFKAKLEAGTS